MSDFSFFGACMAVGRERRTGEKPGAFWARFGPRFSVSKNKTQIQKNSEAGFAIGPILYLLGLIGIGAGILFSSYSQILRSNQQVTNALATKNDLQAIATTIAATSVLGSTDNTVLCPPTAGGASANCVAAAVKVAAIAGQAQLPANAGSIGSTGSPAETGIFIAGS